MKNIMLTACLVLFLFSVSAQTKFEITGKLNGFEDNALVKIERENLILDSCYLKYGKFQLYGTFEESPTPVNLTINNGKSFIYTSLFIGNEKIVINANIDDFPNNVKVEGSKYDSLRYEYVQVDKDLMYKRGQLITEMFSLREQKKWNDSLQNVYWRKSEPLGKITNIDNQLDRNRDQFIDNNFNSYYGLYLLGVYKTEIPKAKIFNYLEKLNPELKNTAYTKSINSHLKNPDLNVGEKYYDFTAFDKSGNKIMLSNYFTNKYVLLDFSTIYCGVCLEAIPELEEIKNSLKENLEIVTFYVDRNQKGFENLGQKHNENWNTIWDKEGRLSDTYSKYKIYGTPTFYLFDPNGKLVQKLEGYSENLYEKINKLILK